MIQYLRRKFGKRKEEYGWFGNYSSWEDASSVAEGYDKSNILEKTKDSLLAVRDGKAVYERDSVLFEKKEYPFPLISFLLHSAFKNASPLNILDFGGSLGSTYFQVKEFLGPEVCASWNVVEQAHYVECGKQIFEDGLLHFFYSIDECEKTCKIDLVLLSSVVQYLPDPHEFLDQIASAGYPYIIIDRTAFINAGSDRLTVQKVWPEVYEASYPSWFFNERTFLSHFEPRYEIMADFSTYVPGESVIKVDHVPIGYDKGFYMVRR
ncbi:methyltransferase, TIGR04325 family [Arcticibacter sp. MXS-1]|uniref:methyltransferase, TIGR04325 family n=1 Tax=Arcticibacter sp. MXS-1 TaxID=3341726 RepID=UPI0035A859AB